MSVVEETLEGVRIVLPQYKRPALLWSGGKDSMILLDMLAALDLDIISFRDPWFAHKYDFLQAVQSKYGLRVYDYPPLAQGFQEGKTVLAFMSVYRMGTEERMFLPKNIEELPEDARELPRGFLCAAHDFFARPLGDIIYPWDLLLVGHKSEDVDQIMGEIPLACDVVKFAGRGPDVYFPLRNWTKADVWDYTLKNKVPVQKDRYGTFFKEADNKRTNPDWIPACVRCVDRRRKDAFVPCPKLKGRLVSSIAARVPYFELGPNNEGLPYFGNHVNRTGRNKA
jgi:hypothetical protein